VGFVTLPLNGAARCATDLDLARLLEGGQFTLN
jgi:hypothetical protein